MPTIYIKLGHWLDQVPSDHLSRPVGPSFTRWLPNGEEDAIELFNSPSVSLKVWFERQGVVAEKYIRFKHKVREVDPAVMARQGRLDAGPLYGRFSLANVDEATATVVREGKQGDELYQKLGKQILKLMIPKVSRFVMILRTLFGQHWLADISEWDSERESLGGYCQSWSMDWSFDQVEWQDFIPDRPSSTITLDAHIREDYSCYITKDDWAQLGTLFRSDYKPSDAVEICNRSRYLLDEGHLRYALIEAMSALEIAVIQYVRRKSTGPLNNDVMNRLDEMHAKGRMALVAYLVPGISPKDIELAAAAIDHRNAMIHDGAEVPENVRQLVEAAMRIIMAVLDGPLHKFPPNDGTNRLFPAEAEQAE